MTAEKTSTNTITVKDGTTIYYKDWGKGQPVVFSHGWPLNADAWDAQMIYLGQRGFRVIAHDRRSHGRSGQTWDGNEMDTYADDLATLFETLDLKNVVMVGHSTGGGEVARYLGRHGSKRVSKAVLISAVPPIMVKSDKNPGGLPIEVFDGLRASFLNDRSQFFKDLSLPSSAITGREPRSRREFARTSGSRECKAALKVSTIASRHFPRLTLTTI
jgi:non-heme chloroperoxidase